MFNRFSGHQATRRSKQLRPHQHFQIAPALVLFLLLISRSAVWCFSPDEDLTARAAVLMDAATGKILYQKEPDLRLPPASTTKIVTAIVTLESGRKLKDFLTVSKAATRVPATKLYLRPGQTITIEDLLYALLLSSANDASLVLAEGISGSVEQFTELMTKRAHELGATNSHFSNPHGLTAPDHYSTTRDLAILFRYAMKNVTFREIVQTRISSVSSNSVVRKKTVARRISVRNHNRLLWNFDGAIGGKTGYTAAAQKCFVGAVERNGVTLIVSILGARDQWGDTKRLLEYGFDNYETLKANTQSATRGASGELAGIRPEAMSALVIGPENNKLKAVDRYFLQIGAFRERDRAEYLLKQVNEKGFSAFVEKATLGKGETAYRVRVGPYADLVEAQEMAGEILARSGYQPVILPPQREPKGDPS
ncbi:MAG TPA: D-alanyl-D-alanine carboxypeptidase [Methylomirabilota bacterium]|nr:D-alanyl-D-alanine carboxypeptidase [Methylomirabilota bacterium]